MEMSVLEISEELNKLLSYPKIFNKIG